MFRYKILIPYDVYRKAEPLLYTSNGKMVDGLIIHSVNYHPDILLLWNNFADAFAFAELMGIPSSEITVGDN